MEEKKFAIALKRDKHCALLTTPENTITYHNALCLSPQNLA